jgi:hypothetical protein
LFLWGYPIFFFLLLFSFTNTFTPLLYLIKPHRWTTLTRKANKSWCRNFEPAKFVEMKDTHPRNIKTNAPTVMQAMDPKSAPPLKLHASYVKEPITTLHSVTSTPKYSK